MANSSALSKIGLYESSDDSDSPPRKFAKEFGTYFGKLLESGDQSDVTVVVKGIEVHVHQFILSVRSSVFRKMFTTDMTESRDKRVIIDDIEFDVMYELFQFMYSSNTPNIHRLSFELLEAADKYDIKDLKNNCVKILEKNITTSTATSILALSNRCNVETLKILATNFIIENTIECVLDENSELRKGFVELPAAALRDLFIATVSKLSPNKRIRIN